MSLSQVTSTTSLTSIIQTTENRNSNSLGLTIKSCANKTYEVMSTIINRIPRTIKGAAIGAVTGAVSGGILSHVLLCMGTYEQTVDDKKIQVSNPLFCSFEQVYPDRLERAFSLDVQSRFTFCQAIIGALIGGVIGGLRGTKGNTANTASVKAEITARTEEFELEAITVEQTTNPTTEETQALIAKS